MATAARTSKAATQQELMAIARLIRADKIDILAIQYLKILEPTLTQIQYDEGYRSVQVHFKCLKNWCDNNLGVDSRQRLYNILKKAADAGLLHHSALKYLQLEPLDPTGSIFLQSQTVSAVCL